MIDRHHDLRQYPPPTGPMHHAAQNASGTWMVHVDAVFNHEHHIGGQVIKSERLADSRYYLACALTIDM
jgi:hypothetical protein